MQCKGLPCYLSEYQTQAAVDLCLTRNRQRISENAAIWKVFFIYLFFKKKWRVFERRTKIVNGEHSTDSNTRTHMQIDRVPCKGWQNSNSLPKRAMHPFPSLVA